MSWQGNILHTSIRWTELQSLLQHLLLTDSKCISGSSAEKIDGQTGFLSEVLKVNLKWYPEVPKLPKKLLLKVPPSQIEEMINDKSIGSKVQQVIEKLFTAENSFYHFFRQHEHSPFSSLLPLPHFYLSYPYGNTSTEYMLMEFVENTVHMRLYENMNNHQMDEVLRFLARLQAFGISKKASEQRGLKMNMFRVLYQDVFTVDKMIEMYSHIPEVFGNHLIEPVDKLLEKMNEIFNLDIAHDICKNMLLPQTLVHGDLWCDNILWEDGNRDVLKAIIDWQMVHVGCPAEDFVRVFNSCLSGENRRDNWKMYLQRFHSYLEEEMGAAPYYLETLIHAYEAIYPMATSIYIPPLAPIVSNMLETITDETKKKEYMDVVTEKITCMVEDVIVMNNKMAAF